MVMLLLLFAASAAFCSRCKGIIIMCHNIYNRQFCIMQTNTNHIDTNNKSNNNNNNRGNRWPKLNHLTSAEQWRMRT